MIFWLTACATAPAWTDTGAVAPLLHTLDRDGDGRVDHAEYDRVRWSGPPFPSADVDGDGALDAGELLRLFRGQSPTAFDGAAPEPPPLVTSHPGHRRTVRQEETLEVLTALADSLRAAGDPAPTADELESAATTAHLDSPECLALLARMRPAWEHHGWTWPTGVPG